MVVPGGENVWVIHLTVSTQYTVYQHNRQIDLMYALLRLCSEFRFCRVAKHNFNEKLTYFDMLQYPNHLFSFGFCSQSCMVSLMLTGGKMLLQT